MSESAAFVRTDGIVASYRNALRRRPVLHNVSFCAAAGEITAVVGPNGAGKTTLFRVVSGLLRPTRGSCTINGLDPARYRQTRGIAYLPENTDFPAGWTARRFLARAADLSCGPRHRAAAFDRAVKRAELQAETLSKLLRSCSHGIQRRVAFAWARTGDPRLFVLDEPFAGLDPKARVGLRRQLRSAREQGTTVLMASHDLHEVERLADKILVLHRGRLGSASARRGHDGSLAGALESELVELK